MTLQITHATVAAGTDSGNGEIHKAQWNEAHSLSMATNKLLGRSAAGTGSVEELTIGAQLSLSGGTLNVGTGIPVASSTMNTNKILGRTTASSGAVEELSIGTGLNLSSGTLAVGTGIPITAVSMNTNKLLGRSTAATGVVEELTVGNNLSLSSGTLNVSSSVIQNLDLVKVSRTGGVITDITDYNNVSVSGLASYTWAQFIDVSFDLTTARHVIVTDKHSSRAGYGGSLWYIDPSAPSGSKQQCRSGGIVTTWGGRPTVSSFVGLEIIISDYLYSRYISDGTNYVPKGAQLIYHNTGLGTVTAPTCTVTAASTKYTVTGGVPTIPAAMLYSGARLRIQHTCRKTGANGAAKFDTFFGTAGDNNDAGICTATTSAGDAAYARANIILEFTSTTNAVCTYNSSEGGNGSTASILDRSTHINTTSAMLLSFYTGTTFTTGDTLALQLLSIFHEA